MKTYSEELFEKPLLLCGDDVGLLSTAYLRPWKVTQHIEHYCLRIKPLSSEANICLSATKGGSSAGGTYQTVKSLGIRVMLKEYLTLPLGLIWLPFHRAATLL